MSRATVPNLPSASRRGFLKSATAGSLVVAFHIPFIGEAAAQGAMAPEVNAWVVVKPDDTIVIRIARSEMGQGTLTGLAQLVAEELDADWSRVTTDGAVFRRGAAAASASRTSMCARAAPARA
jgi:isoquinoline 1-oxidoreductase beta subunit